MVSIRRIGLKKIRCTPFMVTRNRTGNRGGTKPDDKGQCQIPGTVDNPARKTKRKTNWCTEEVLSLVHTATVCADERDSCENERNRKKRKTSEDEGPWCQRTFLERFETRQPSSGRRNRQKKRACEANARRDVRTKLRPSGKWNAGELEKFKCARLWRRLRKSLFSFVLRKAASVSSFPSLFLRLPTTNFAFALSWF